MVTATRSVDWLSGFDAMRSPLHPLKSVAISVQSMSLSDDAQNVSIDGIDLDSGRAVTVSIVDRHEQFSGRRIDAEVDQLVLVLTLERVS